VKPAESQPPESQPPESQPPESQPPESQPLASQSADRRRRIPPTTELLADRRLASALTDWSRPVVLAAIRSAQQSARDGFIRPDEVAVEAVARLPQGTSLHPVLNATGVVVHTNLGRAPLSAGAVNAVIAASGYVDVEFDLVTGVRRTRGKGALDVLRRSLPDAGDVLVVNNGAAALLLAVTGTAAGREVVWSRGELVEIGDGFRLPALAASTGARIREVGTTNRTTVEDYAAALGPETGCVLKVHPSNFRVEGYTSSVSVAALVALGAPVVVDVGSGLLRPDPLLPDEPDVTTMLREGAALVTASGDKLLGGPQLGLIAGDADLVSTLRRHPLARALRVDKLTLAALEATLLGPPPPVWAALHADPSGLRARCEAVAATVGGEVVATDGAVGGGGAPGVALPGWAVAVPESFAEQLRLGEPAVVARVERGRCLIDLRCIPPAADRDLCEAVRRCT
jgi:L-seryl-tRNA(Ser) seleniumtransferase